MSQPNRNTREMRSFSWFRFSQTDAGGFSLIELLVSLSALGVVAMILSVLLVSALQSQEFSSRQDELVQIARLAMERMVVHIKQADSILRPPVDNPTGTTLELGGFDQGQGTNLQYYLATTTLWEQYPKDHVTTLTTPLAEQVDTFQVQRLTGANGATLIDVFLRLRDDKGHVVELQTRAFPRNG
jgi:prepilin-type N-terminal cleavage/methylation domain-containing protein